MKRNAIKTDELVDWGIETNEHGDDMLYLETEWPEGGGPYRFHVCPITDYFDWALNFYGLTEYKDTIGESLIRLDYMYNEHMIEFLTNTGSKTVYSILERTPLETAAA